MHAAAHKNEAIRFTVDGRPVTSSEKDVTAADVLRLAGLDPTGYDLAEVRRGQADPKPYRDDQRVTVKDGDTFVSIRQRADVA